jgi:uncharacterized membrane protein
MFLACAVMAQMRGTNELSGPEYDKRQVLAIAGNAGTGDTRVPELGIGLWLHIGAGAVALAAGAVALAASKGETLHRRAGTVFVAAMLAMTGIAVVLATLLGHWESVLAGAVTLYLVVTAWNAARGAGGATPEDAWLAAAALGLSIFGIMLAGAAGMSATGKLNGYPPELYLTFAGLAGWAALWDLTYVAHGTASGRARIARHLWRMCMALAIAAASFFLGQPEYFPQSLRGTWILALPPLAALALMVMWFAIVWGTRRFQDGDRA